MKKQCYYSVLGVGRESCDQDIKKAYRRLAMESHPDRNPGDTSAEEKFKAAAEAYEVLRDPEKRALYDKYGHQGLSRQGFEGFHNTNDIFSHFGDLFSDLFGGMGGGRRGSGANLRYDLELEFEDAIQGAKKDITVPRHRSCETCSGSGAKPGTQPERCKHCQGRGQVIHQQGFFSLSTPCPVCRGAGTMIKEVCPTCKGAGKERVERTVTVRIPPGVDDGMQLRLRGEGELGDRGTPPGDLYVVLHVKRHEYFQRNEFDIHVPCEISFVQAALGAKVQVKTLEGEETLQIAPGTQHGEQKTLRQRGVARLNEKGRGDFTVHFQVTIPKELDDKGRELLVQFAQHAGIALD
jgi:molecular chaperone DnaJ